TSPSFCWHGSSPRVDELRAWQGAGERLAIVDVDLASLGSVDRACEEVERLLGGCQIDALVLKAGIQAVGGDQASAPGSPSLATFSPTSSSLSGSGDGCDPGPGSSPRQAKCATPRAFC